MKSLTLTIVVAVLAVIVFISFKTEAVKKEYAQVYCHGFGATIHLPDGSEKEVEYKPGVYYKETNKIFNNMANEGWSIIEVMNGGGTVQVIYLERIRQ